jgi:hypothetical protein
MSCDLCGKVTSDLHPLDAQYRTKNIQVFCRSCERRANRRLWSLKRLVRKRMLDWIKRQAKSK